MLIVYAGTEFLTADAIALALVDYSQALARVGAAESVEVPVREADGSVRTAIFLVGPASQLVAKETAPASGEELIDEGVVADLEARTRRLRPPTTGQYTDEWI